MPNLYWKSADSRTRNLVEYPFESEMKLEEYLAANQDLLDVYMIARQTRTGSGAEILDIIGIDQESKVCIIELKNDAASADVIQ